MPGGRPFQGEDLSGFGLFSIGFELADVLTFRAACFRRRKLARKFAAKRSSRVVLL